MGVVARILEEEGLSTVIVMTFREVAEIMRLPRAVYVRFPIGLTPGEPGSVTQQRVVIEDALAFLQDAREPGSLQTLPYRWGREDYRRVSERRAKNLSTGDSS